MAKEKRSVAVNLRITPSMRAALEKMAAKDERSLSGMILLLLKKAIADAEEKTGSKYRR
jgi:hypothetical protein